MSHVNETRWIKIKAKGNLLKIIPIRSIVSNFGLTVQKASPVKRSMVLSMFFSDFNTIARLCIPVLQTSQVTSASFL